MTTTNSDKPEDVSPRTTVAIVRGLTPAGSPKCRLIRFLLHLHRDVHGSISIVSVFTVLLLTFLLGMVMNSTRQVDQKIRLQNAADAATYSGGVVITRSMNTLSFTNHLLCDVFALTAFMREGKAQSSASQAPQMLENWGRVAKFLATAQYQPFAQLGQTLQQKIPAEEQMVQTFSQWSSAASQAMLPVLEQILSTEAIPNFQRAVANFTPQTTQIAMEEVANRHGNSWPRPAVLHGVMWRTMADPVGGASESQRRSLPVVDPVMDSQPNQSTYLQYAIDQRRIYSNRYLADWNNEQLVGFDRYGKLSQFANLWRGYTCGQLKQLLEQEYPQSNLLFQIRTLPRDLQSPQDQNTLVEQDYMFVGVVYMKKIPDYVPGVFKNPIASDTQGFSQIMMFVPRRRLLNYQGGNWSQPSFPAVAQGFPPNQPPNQLCWNELMGVRRQSGGYFPDYRSQNNAPFWQDAWSLTAQNWTTQLVPATSSGVPAILSTQPSVGNAGAMQVPNVQGMQQADLYWVNNH